MKNTLALLLAIGLTALGITACDAPEAPSEVDEDASEELGQARQPSSSCTWESGWDAPGQNMQPSAGADSWPADADTDSEYGDYYCDTYTAYFKSVDTAYVAVQTEDRPTSSITCTAATLQYRYRTGTDFNNTVLWGSWTSGSVNGVYYSGGGSGACTLRKSVSVNTTYVQIEAYAEDLAGDALDLDFVGTVD